MKLAIMQPYVFPYIGYYQLVAAVDTFVFFDDVSFIKKGWINRNRLLNKDEPLIYSIPLAGASQNKRINEIKIADFNNWKNKFLKTLEMNYKKAPYFSFVFDWLDQFLLKDFLFISDLAAVSVKAVSELLNLKTQFKNSADINYKNGIELNGEQKVISICKILGAGKYINPKNGQNLYNKQKFKESEIQLNFINMNDISYNQFSNNKFVPSLSIIDVLMFNNIETVIELLKEFELK